MASQFPLLRSPLQIGGVTLPNRIVRSAHATLFSRGAITEEHIRFHKARGEGGIGLTILEGVSVHPSSTFSLRLDDDSGIAALARLAGAIAPTGMKLFQQLWHGGAMEPAANGAPPWSVSNQAGRFARIPPVAMTSAQIRALVTAYGDTALRLAQAGIDGAEVLAGNGYLFSAFLSPVLNTREDDYGGSPENRLRFLEEVLTEIRTRTPAGFALGARMGSAADQSLLSSAEVNAAIRHLGAQGLLDYINLSQGDYFYHVERYAAMDKGAGYQLDAIRETGAGLAIPRLVVGRFGTLDDAEAVLRAGQGEMVNMVRATIADPDLVRKELDGRGTGVRPCIACNQGCIGGLFSGRMGCTVNPTVGREDLISEAAIRPVDDPQRVVVIGGGPAGMEAARVAALFGHRVSLYEATPDLGGQILMAARLPFNHGIADITRWQEREIFRLGVAVHLSHWMEAEDILALDPDLVILATGAMPAEPAPLRQVASPTHVITPAPGAMLIDSEQLITGRLPPRIRSAVVFDEPGHYEAIGACELLLDQGVAVTYITRHAIFAPEIDKTGRAQAALRRFYRKGVFRVETSAMILGIRPGEVDFRPLDAVTNQTIAADLVVNVGYRDAFREPWQAMTDAGLRVMVVGDAVSPRDLVLAIREGHFAAHSISRPELTAHWSAF